MKFAKGIVLAGSLGLVSASTAFSTPRAQPLDFGKINATLQDALAGVAPTFEGVSNFNYQLDENGTDLDKDQYKVNLTARLDQQSWSTAPVDLAAVISYRAENLGTQDERSEFTVAATVKADPVALFSAMAKKETCPPSDMKTGVMRIIAEQNCAVAPSLASARTISELYGITNKHLQDQKTALQTYEAGLDEELTMSKNADIHQLLAAQRKLTQELLSDLDGVQLRSTGKGFVLSAQHFGFGALASVDDYTLTVEPGVTSLSMTLKTPLGTKVYTAMKPEIEHLLQGLESHADFAVEAVQMKTRFMINYLRANNYL